MTPEARFHSYVVAGTIGVMFFVVFYILPKAAPHSGSEKAAISAIAILGSFGFYRLLAVALSWLGNRWLPLQKFLLGPEFVGGTWIGKLRTKTGRKTYIVEHYEQTLSSLVIRGRSFKPNRELDATWHTHSAQIDAKTGVLYVFYATNVARKNYSVEGIGRLEFDRERPDAGPKTMSGYSIDSDAGLEIAADESIKIIYEELHKLDDRLIPMKEAKTRAFDRYAERSA